MRLHVSKVRVSVKMMVGTELGVWLDFGMKNFLMLNNNTILNDCMYGNTYFYNYIHDHV